MVQTQLNEIAIFLLRVALGTMFLAHSLILKLLDFTLPGTAEFFVYFGLPAVTRSNGAHFPAGYASMGIDTS